MPVSFSFPQHPTCLCKGPAMLPPAPLLFPARNVNLQPAWTPMPRMALPITPSKPKKIIRIKDPQTGHDVTEEILSSASVGRARGEVFCEQSLPRMPPAVMKPTVPLVLPCTPRCMCRPMPQVPLPYNCPQCLSDFEQELWWKNGIMRQENQSRKTCACSLCQQASNGNTKFENRRQYCYSRKFLMKLRNHPASQVKPKELPDFILPGFYDSNWDKENQLLGSGDHSW